MVGKIIGHNKEIVFHFSTIIMNYTSFKNVDTHGQFSQVNKNNTSKDLNVYDNVGK